MRSFSSALMKKNGKEVEILAWKGRIHGQQGSHDDFCPSGYEGVRKGCPDGQHPQHWAQSATASAAGGIGAPAVSWQCRAESTGSC